MVEQRRPAASSKEVQNKVHEAYDAVKAYAMAKKEEFSERAEKVLGSYETQIDQLKFKAEKVKGEATKRFNELLDEGNIKKVALEKDLEQMKAAGDDAWENAEKRINTGMKELHKSYERARSTFA